ncbi:SDR family NAD(P)-dependent oxidoreductase [Sulfobacillus harzensis]|uniref:SDR family oxidoreductase n=1 Tax=Sulfobacillus harzensis TaxID=2729629 RepID=A0A7Y0Q3Y3_9FIRM|nr:SDR family oxidoreductase [Sulfobacillus harzensis]NMP23461.1 SDR family oxidoreductase [Sulfobacillus harzensis]
MRILASGISGGIGQAFRARVAECHPDWVVEGLARRPNADDHRFDLTWPLDRMVDALSQLPAIDALLCLAGADILSPPLRHAPYLERLEALYRVDVAGTVKTVQAALPRLSPGGIIILMGWDRAGLGKAGEAGELYALAKGALTSWGKSLAKSLGERATVYVVAPGWVQTRWGDALSPAERARIAAKTATGRWQTPDEVAHVLESLLTFPRGLSTGQVIYVNGGDVLPS